QIFGCIDLERQYQYVDRFSVRQHGDRQNRNGGNQYPEEAFQHDPHTFNPAAPRKSPQGSRNDEPAILGVEARGRCGAKHKDIRHTEFRNAAERDSSASKV
ncbi:MAG: hypothetical protein ACWGNK_02110, partial [Desulfobacterales bacterium]